MKRTSVSVALCVALAAPLAHAQPAADPGATDSQVDAVRASFVVDTSDVGNAGPILRQRLLERGGKVFRDANVLPSKGGDDPRVVLVIEELVEPEPGYAFEISLERLDRTSDARNWSVQCPLCSETELIERAAQELGKVAATIMTLSGTESGTDSDSDSGSDSGTEPVAVDRGRLDPMIGAGIGVLAVGIVGAGVGVGLALAPPKVLPDDPTRERYTQPPGYALIAVGGAALIAGAVLLAIGLKRQKSQRVQASAGGLRVRF